MVNSEERIPSTPHDIEAIRTEIGIGFDGRDLEGRKISDAKYGVYVFYDYDGEPIYVGRTYEKLRTRIGRHLTNQRTDAVAMNVLDPFEVAEVAMWPLWELENSPDSQRARGVLMMAEYTVYRQALRGSRFGAVLNEKEIPEAEIIDLPPPYRFSIIPESLYQTRKHPDVRIARRAATIANLARVIRERAVTQGLRRTLVIQARRLEWLVRRRHEETGGGSVGDGTGSWRREDDQPVS